MHANIEKFVFEVFAVNAPKLLQRWDTAATADPNTPSAACILHGSQEPRMQ